MYNPDKTADRDVLREYEVQHVHDGQAERVTISEAEVERAIKTMRNKKAAGVCGIPFFKDKGATLYFENHRRISL